MKKFFLCIFAIIGLSISIAGESCYLFTSFREPADAGLRFLYSRDAVNWDTVPGIWLKPMVGDGIIRDPSIALGPDSTYHLVWTIAWKGDTGFGYSSSKNLRDWTPQRRIPAMDSVASAQNLWAPEIFYDDAKGRFMIVFASCVPDAGFDVGIEDVKNNHRLYYVTTTDFVTFSQPKLLYDPGFSSIDATLVKRAPGDYVMIFKDNTRPNRNLKAAFATTPEGPWSAPTKAFTDQFTEGPSVVKIGDEYMVYYDAYKKYRYGAHKTTDFLKYTDVTDSVSVPRNHKHGTILTVPSSIVDGLLSPPLNNFDNQYRRPLGEMLNEVARRFNVKFKYEVDTTGILVPYADSRVRPYSADETLANLLMPFDLKAMKQRGNLYKIRKYEQARRTDADGEKLIAYLNSLYADRSEWESRRDSLRSEVRSLLTIDRALSLRVGGKPVFSQKRVYDGYSVSNFYIETHPGLYVCGSVYEPLDSGKHPLVICPNGHFAQGRYNESQQLRLASLARMGAICVDYDLYGWGESELQVGSTAHQTAQAQIVQAMNGMSILDFMMARDDVDSTRIGVNGGSGGGSQVVLLSLIDPRYTASCPVVSLASHFNGGCPCESGMPIHTAGGGTCNAELAAAFAPRPMMVVSDGGDWTHTVPWLEYPYLQRIYGFYGAEQNVRNIHLPDEGHDFGPNKRNAVYDFFIHTFGLDGSRLDESKVTIEPISSLLSFGPDGTQMPQNAIRKKRN
ncbi:MAG: glycoside hydrolase family 43 protein [Muribaculaceae bacterium]|nr:glycoside hydrolase family 43 protein [Muribaculaceae bacterium]